ncbi:MAG: hypothetical protein ABIK28_01345 [Planctomycetota bacterium]
MNRCLLNIGYFTFETEISRVDVLEQLETQIKVVPYQSRDFLEVDLLGIHDFQQVELAQLGLVNASFPQLIGITEERTLEIIVSKDIRGFEYFICFDIACEHFDSGCKKISGLIILELSGCIGKINFDYVNKADKRICGIESIATAKQDLVTCFFYVGKNVECFLISRRIFIDFYDQSRTGNKLVEPIHQQRGSKLDHDRFFVDNEIDIG